MNMPYLPNLQKPPRSNIWLILFILALILWVMGLMGRVRANEPLKASWYSIESLKKEGTYKYSKGVMANGKPFNDLLFTCATRLFPLGVQLKVTNTQNQKSVVVVVTDRIGKKFAKTRIDLSKRAFAQIANLQQGIIPVKIEVIK